MALIRVYEPATRVGLMELDGLLSILDERARELGENGDAGAYYHLGAHYALTIIRYHGRIEYPQEFMALFEQYVEGDE